MDCKRIYLSVVIPAYNESKILSKNIEKVASCLSSKDYTFELIVVDDGSVDNTKDLITSMIQVNTNIKLMVNIKNMGKGFSVKSGVLAAQGKYILFSDADFSTSIEELEKLLPYFEQGFDIVVGSRAIRGANILLKQSWLRQSMGKVFNLLVRLLCLADIKDTQCGFKCFSRDAAGKIFPLQRFSGFCFDVEVLNIAKRCGYKIKEVPIVWVNRVDSRVGIIKDSLEMFLDLFKIRFNILRGFYNVT